jgi:leucyl-tRNA synthetase
VQAHGADVVRGYVLFMGSYTDGGDWHDANIPGVERFFRRVREWVVGSLSATGSGNPDEETTARRTLHKTIKKVGEDIPALSFNTAVAALMEAMNELRRSRLSRDVHRELARTFVLLLAPIAPFMAEELWEQLGGRFSVHQQRWPAYDPRLAADETVVIGVQINGKLRARVEVPADAGEEAVRQQAFASPELQQQLSGKQVVKSFYVPGRLLNVVVK